MLTAWIIFQKKGYDGKNNYIKILPFFLIIGTIYAFIFIILLIQPDFGSSFLLMCPILSQLIIAGLKLKFLFIGFFILLLLVFSSYILLPHVSYRINLFLLSINNSKTEENFQLKKSIQSFFEGGLLGKGPGAGTVKQNLPDVHADFIFPCIAEEYGLITCFFIIMLYLIIFSRTIKFLLKETDMFKIISISGLTATISIQTIINMSSSLGLIPTKGTTLPFISYGGSSLIASSIIVGFILSLTRNKLEDQKL